MLVTGATGYLGRRVARALLEAGHEVGALLRPTSAAADLPAGVTVLRAAGDAQSVGAALEVARPEAIVHLAAAAAGAEGLAALDAGLEANLALGVRLLAAQVALGLPRRFLQTGTFWEGGAGGGAGAPVDLYAASKLAFQAVLDYYVAAHQHAALTLRLFHTYGPGDPRPKVFAHLAGSVGASPPRPFSAGAQVLDLVHVDDVARAYVAGVGRLLAAEPGWSATCELGSGQGLTLRELAALCERVWGRSLAIEWGALPYRPREVMDRVADLAPAQRLLGWSPRIALAEGIAGLGLDLA